ncbi:hypothetical protein JTB14_002664 [Gonioctena quinquepunctata]|nr:hypothetical protein JTB14_002664 [Gonioctena quinquepunctata]
MDHSACAAEVTCGHSVRNDLGNESESNKNDCGYHQEEIFSHTIASVESFMVQLKREGYYDGIFVMKTLTLYWNTLSSYLTSSNPATVNTAKSKLSEIAVLWKEIRNDQELMGIFQYGSFEIIWRYVERIKKEIDEFSDSKGSDQYKSISQFLSNYKFFLQANEIIKSAEKRKLISEIKCISKYFEEKTSRHGDEMTSKTTRMEELGSRDNKHMSKSKVNELRNRYENVESKLPEDAEKRAQNMVDTKVAGDEKTQSMTHDAKKDENKIKLHRIEKRRDEIKQEIDRFEGTTSDPKLHELIEYSVRLILEMDDLSLERGSDLQNKKIALLKEVYQYSDILAKKAQEKEFEQVETYINDIQENFEYHTNSENLKKSKGKIEKVRMRLNGINASIDSQQRKSGLMKMINNIEKILEDTEQKERKREEEVSSSILTEQIEKNKSLTIDADNCEEAIDIFNKNIVPVVGESSDLEKKEEEENIDGVGKINTENNPQEITEKLQQLNLEDRLDTKMPDQSMDLINESNETEVVTSDKNGSNASFTYEKRNDQFVMGAHNKQDLFGYFENRIDKIDKQIHCAFSCRQCDVLKEELLELHEHLEQYVFKNEDDVNINKLKGKLFKSLEFVESRRESLAVIGNEKPKSSETQF